MERRTWSTSIVSNCEVTCTMFIYWSVESYAGRASPAGRRRVKVGGSLDIHYLEVALKEHRSDESSPLRPIDHGATYVRRRGTSQQRRALGKRRSYQSTRGQHQFSKPGRLEQGACVSRREIPCSQDPQLMNLYEDGLPGNLCNTVRGHCENVHELAITPRLCWKLIVSPVASRNSMSPAQSGRRCRSREVSWMQSDR